MVSPSLLATALLLLGQPGLGGQPDQSTPIEIASRLSSIGERVSGERGYEEALEVAAEVMILAGLEQVEVFDVPGRSEFRNITGLLPGASGLEILLTAHLDTVRGTRGAADNSAGVAVVLAAAAALEELPRHHTVRVMLFDGEEEGQVGSSQWVASLDAEQRDAVLGAVNVDLVGWRGGDGGVVLVTVLDEQPHRAPPGWLVHAVVGAGRAVGAPISVGAARLSGLAQLVGRSAVPGFATDSDALLRGGIPAVTLSDADLFAVDARAHGPEDRVSRLDAGALADWTARVTASVRRLDSLAGRPRDDDRFLALFGRVWSRRTLYWLGLSVWVALVFRGLPGRWRGRAAEERARRGRSYLPGFTLRLLLLACILMLPVLSALLLLPAALLCVAGSSRPVPWRVSWAIAGLPWALWIVGLGYAAAIGRVGAIALSLPAIALLLGSFASLLWYVREQEG